MVLVVYEAILQTVAPDLVHDDPGGFHRSDGAEQRHQVLVSGALVQGSGTPSRRIWFQWNPTPVTL